MTDAKLETQRFVRKPFYVDAVQVTSENIERVAAWCKGDVRTTGKGDPDIQTIQDPTTSATRVPEKYVKVFVQRPMNDQQTMAFVGDWVLFAGTGFKVYKPRAFERSFEAFEKPGPIHVARDAGSGEFVSPEYAEAHPDTTVSENR